MDRAAAVAWRRGGGRVLHPQRPGDRAVAGKLRLARARLPDRSGGADLSRSIWRCWRSPWRCRRCPSDFARMPWIAAGSQARDIWSGGWPSGWAVEIATHLTMTHGLLPDAVVPGAWVSFLGSAWSLSTEWQFYVLALLVGARIGPGKMVVAFLCLAVAGLLWQAAAPHDWQFSRAFLPNKAQFFALGIASASVVRGGGDVALRSGAGGDAGDLRDWRRAEKLLPPLVWTVCLAAQLRPDVAGLRPLALRAAVALAAVARRAVLLHLSDQRTGAQSARACLAACRWREWRCCSPCSGCPARYCCRAAVRWAARLDRGSRATVGTRLRAVAFDACREASPATRERHAQGHLTGVEARRTEGEGDRAGR